MPRCIDMLQCKKCGTWYAPELTATARVKPHCLDLPLHTIKPPARGSIIDLEV